MRVFLDVGAHHGQTARVALHPRYAFDRVVSFDPVASCCAEIRRRLGHHPRLELNEFGLGPRTEEAEIFAPGTLGASRYADAQAVREAEAAERCRFVRASHWFRDNVRDGDFVVLKLNCEGAECDILDDLIDSGEIRKVTHAMVDFDVRKIPSQRHRQAEVQARLEGLDRGRFRTPEEVLLGPTIAARIDHWLRAIGAVPADASARVAGAVHDARELVLHTMPRAVAKSAAAAGRGALGVVLPDRVLGGLRQAYRRWFWRAWPE